MARTPRFTTTLTDAGRGQVFVAVPFDPDAAWGAKERHHVHGTIGGHGFRGVVEEHALGRGIVLAPAWCRDRAVTVGSRVDLVMEAEGLQRDDLAPDLAAALAAAPDAGACFDGLAQFYRTGSVKWIEGTKRLPEVRALRIAEVVRLLQAGQKA